MQILTVEELRDLCEKQITLGNGDKQILISDDDEGNGYHSLFYGFADDETAISDCFECGMFHDGNDPKNVVLLG